MGRFSDITQDRVPGPTSINPSNLASSSRNGQASTSKISQTYFLPTRHIASHNTYETVSDDEDELNMDIPPTQELNDEDNLSSEEEELFGNMNHTEPVPITEGYSDIGDPLIECEQCHTYMWNAERTRKCRHAATPRYQLCCGQGKIQLPLLGTPPKLLEDLLFGNDSPDCKNFQQNI